MWEEKLMHEGIFRTDNNKIPIQDYVFKPPYPGQSKYDYPPENTTFQNMEEYKRRRALEEQNLSLNNSNFGSVNFEEQIFFTDYNTNNNTELDEFNQKNNIISQKESEIRAKLNRENEENDKKKNKITEKKENLPPKVEDPDEMLFMQNNKELDKNKVENDNSELSDVESEHNSEEKDYNDKVLAQYENIKRIKSKWKIVLKGCIVQKDNDEYVFPKIHGELSRDW